MTWSLALAILTLADAPKAGAADAKKIEGKWQVVTHEHGGVKMPAKDVKKLTVQIKGGTFTSREDGKLKEEGTFTLDPKAKPKAIDVKILIGSDRDKQAKGIYKLEGDTLTVCIAEPDKERPKVFAGKEKTGHTLLVMKRIRE